jgi:hypothetical protein
MRSEQLHNGDVLGTNDFVRIQFSSHGEVLIHQQRQCRVLFVQQAVSCLLCIFREFVHATNDIGIARSPPVLHRRMNFPGIATCR